MVDIYKCNENTRHFFERYRAYAERITDDCLKDATANFEKMKVDITLLRKVDDHENHEKAPGFNIFKILGLSTEEVRTHSAFLANLLNPKGTHGQGDIFLKELFRVCHSKGGSDICIDEIDSRYWRVEIEKWMPWGRMDIVVSNSNQKNGTLIVIENKIFALEQEDQLSRYWKWMNTQRRHYHCQILVYLTLSGKHAITGNQTNYIPLSYKDDICDILSNSQSNIKPLRVRETIHQYVALVKELCRKEQNEYKI
jgi:hypothetical protein